MRLLNDRQLATLVHAQPFPCVSIYLELGRTVDERQAAPSRLKKLVREADKTISGMPEIAAKPLLMAPFGARALSSLDDVPEDTRGVAIFRSFRTSGIYAIDHSVADVVTVSDTFHLKPLLPKIQGHDAYYAVVLNHKLIRLYRGNEHRLVLVETFEAPVETRDSPVSPLTERRERAAQRGRFSRYAITRMPSAGKVEDFVRNTEKHIRMRLEGRAAPVVLVGSPLMRRFYRMTCQHGYLVPDEISATFGVHEKEAIHKATWTVARQELSRRSMLVATAYRRLEGTAQASDSLEEIAGEALRGRVSDILVSKSDRRFGRLERRSGKIIPLSPDESSVGDDVLCDIAQEVMLRGGAAYLLAKHDMPTDAPLSAIYRW